MSPGNSRYPGTCPAEPVICRTAPDDWLCSWFCHLSPETSKPFWELKFIHRSCRLHGRLPSRQQAL